LVGFPGETEEDFQKTFEFAEKSNSDFFTAACYSVATNTPAARMKQIPEKIKLERCKRMDKLLFKKVFSNKFYSLRM
jgi:tRNA A37 methylthiotransferase MiaB